MKKIILIKITLLFFMSCNLGQPLKTKNEDLTLGKDNEERSYAYRELFRHHIDNEQIHEIREALNQELVLGRDDFKDKINKNETKNHCA